MSFLPKPRKTLSLKRPVQPNWAVLEYRLVWNETSVAWDIYRNGMNTGSSRRKKRSAIDTAILAIKADHKLVGAKASVISVKDGLLKPEWQGVAANQ
jgi:hypothetical protein